eukprot:10684_1
MLSKFSIQTSRLIENKLYRASCIYSSHRYKTYLVGVDGSDYGYNALKFASKNAKRGDRIISMYIPTSVALFMERTQTFRLSDSQIDSMKNDLIEAQEKNCLEIESKCSEIVAANGPEHIVSYCKIGKETFVPRDDLMKACYDTKADILCVGSKGLSHSLKEKVTDTMRKVGGLASFAVTHAPCDVVVIKKDHEY